MGFSFSTLKKPGQTTKQRHLLKRFARRRNTRYRSGLRFVERVGLILQNEHHFDYVYINTRELVYRGITCIRGQTKHSLGWEGYISVRRDLNLR